jgi:uncharacterized DUF497 family protein
VEVHFDCGGVQFVWNLQKAAENLSKHGVRFKKTCKVFLDPLHRVVDAGVEQEDREALLGETKTESCYL